MCRLRFLAAAAAWAALVDGFVGAAGRSDGQTHHLTGVKCMRAAESLVVIEELHRNVELSSRTAHVVLNLKVKVDAQAPKDVSEILITPTIEHLKHMTIPVVNGRNPNTDLSEVFVVDPIPPTPDNVDICAPPSGTEAGDSMVDVSELIAAAFVVRLPAPLSPGMSTALDVSYFVGHPYSPLPAKITMAAAHRVIFRFNLFQHSLYPTLLQSTKLRLGGSFIRFEPPIDPAAFPHSVDSTARVLSLGPFKNVPAATSGTRHFVHFALSKDLLFFRRVTREIDISHYGSIFFKEHYEARNEAAALKGEYSRQHVSTWLRQLYGSYREPGPIPPNHIGIAYEAILPRQAYGLEFYDIIGNISSSHARHEPSHVSFEIEPRYPVLGNWNTDWSIEYNLPLKGSLFRLKDSPSTYALNVTFSPPFPNIFAEEVITRVTLPAGASDFKLFTPKMVDDRWVEEKWSWLDLFVPRKVLCLSARNVLVPRNEIVVSRMQIQYWYPAGYGYLEKPLACCFLLALLILLYVAFKRLRFRILTPDETRFIDQNEIRASKAAQILDIVAAVFDSNSYYLSKTAAAANKFAGRPVADTDAQKAFSEIREAWKTSAQSFVDRVNEVADKDDAFDETHRQLGGLIQTVEQSSVVTPSFDAEVASAVVQKAERKLVAVINSSFLTTDKCKSIAKRRSSFQLRLTAAAAARGERGSQHLPSPDETKIKDK